MSAHASASELRTFYIVIVAACLGFWAIVAMAIIRIAHEVSGL